MKNAALNTVLGMGTVFVILILISLIISCFSLIPKIEAAFKKKEPAKEEKKDVVDQIIERKSLLMTVNWLQLSQQRSQLMKLIMAVHHLTDSLLEVSVR